MYQRLRSDGISLPTLNGERKGTFSTIRLAAADSETAAPLGSPGFACREFRTGRVWNRSSSQPGLAPAFHR
jgi:hypothetical protein